VIGAPTAQHLPQRPQSGILSFQTVAAAKEGATPWVVPINPVSAIVPREGLFFVAWGNIHTQANLGPRWSPIAKKVLLHDGIRLPEKPVLGKAWKDTWGKAAWKPRAPTASIAKKASRREGKGHVFAIRITPTPHGPGSLHIATSFTTPTWIYQRSTSAKCAAKEIFYPMGVGTITDYLTERRRPNYYGVRCDPSCPIPKASSLPWEAGASQDGSKPGGAAPHLSAQLHCPCVKNLPGTTEKQVRGPVESAWPQCGLSPDTTAPIETSQAVAQTSVSAPTLPGRSVSSDAPTLWDINL